MTKPVAMPTDQESLKQALHERVNRMEDQARLELLLRIASQLETEALADQIARDFDEERAAGRLSPDAVQRTIDDFRARHPYQ